MSGEDALAILPMLIVAATAVVAMLSLAVKRSHAATFALSAAGLALALLSLPLARSASPRPVSALLTVDGYALYFTGLVLAAATAVTLLSHGYLRKRSVRPEEYYVLLLLATLGACVLIAASHFASFFLGLEILSVSLYTLIAYERTRAIGIEAGVKYLVLAGASSAVLLFGMAMVYWQMGTMALAKAVVFPAQGAEGVIVLCGMGLIAVGVGFKLAVVPFHLWTPDVYQGAPAPVTAFIATVSKGAMFALLLRHFTQADIRSHEAMRVIFTLIAVSSMLLGTLLALMQNRIKRLLAYSSIANMGYLLVAFLAAGPTAVAAVSYYLAAYFATTLGAFGVVTVLSGAEADADDLEQYRGLAGRRPVLAAVFAGMLLSLAGLPLTAGFVGKFYVLSAGVREGLYLPVVVLVASSAIALYYYLRVVLALYQHVTDDKLAAEALPMGEMPLMAEHRRHHGAGLEPFEAPAVAAHVSVLSATGEPDEAESRAEPSMPSGPTVLTAAISVGGVIVLAALAVLVVWLGVYPGPLVRLILSLVGR